jgi:cation diffusion facilitator family transporter
VQDPAGALARGSHAVRLAIAANALLAAAKFTAGLVGHSYALVADGVESMSDIVSSVVVYAGLRVAARPPDAEHPYGHGKAEPVAALTVALALLVAAGLIAVQSIREIRTPHELPARFTLVVLVGVVFAKIALTRYTSGVAAAIDSGAVRGDSAHHMADAITSGLAFVGISIGLWTGRPEADDWAALCAVPVIAFMALRQTRGPMAELMDAAPPFMDQEVRRVALGAPGVVGLDKCFVRKTGLSYYVDLHVIVDGNLTVRAGHEVAHQVQEAIKRALPRVAGVLVHVEPNQPPLAP